MAANLRIKKSSIAGMLETAEAHKTKIESPIPLNERQSFYFDRIVKDRELSSWSANHLIIAANISKSYVNLDDANEDIETNGLKMYSDKGWPTPNPSIAVKTQLTNSIIAQMKSLGITASQQGLSSPEQRSRNEADAKAGAIISNAKEASLIA